MSKFSRLAGIGVLTAGLLGGTATAAFAGGTPTPVPTQQTVTPYPVHHAAPVPWQFDLEQSDLGAVHVNDVEATFPIVAHGWTDTQLSPNVDKFHDAAGDSVTVWHTSIAQSFVQENLRTCTVTLDQPRGFFRIIAGTGTGAHFRSLRGQFDLEAMFSFPLRPRTGVCPLAFIGPRTVLRELTYGGSLLPQPTFDDVAVQGRADLVRVAPIHIFAPTVSPTDAIATNS